MFNLFLMRARGSGGGGKRERQNYFIFIENFQKNQEKLINTEVKLTNQTPIC